jgi:hypothetical protein
MAPWMPRGGARGAIPLQAEANDRYKSGAAERRADHSSDAHPTVRAATWELHAAGAKLVKYRPRGVLHDFRRRGAEFRCE